jgi:putative inorganic carbon (hco3(-)) transporter
LIVLSIILFLTLLFTKSRSGLLAFGIESIVFWFLVGILFFKNQKSEIKTLVKQFCILNFAFLFVIVAIGTPWTPSVSQIFHSASELPTTNYHTTSLETGGTESGQIRKIVWKGALEIWRNYPLVGSGVETFAFSYYKFKPPEHNYTSEWDYLYNKAHNEYLNYLATTGVIGLGAYLFLILASLLQLLNFQFPISNFHSMKKLSNSKLDNSLGTGNWRLETFALLAGYVSILVTNFFGFSVVPISVLFFLFPAMAFTLGQTIDNIVHRKSFSFKQKFTIILILCSMLYALFAIGKYWLADYLYVRGKRENISGDYAHAHATLNDAVANNSTESIYWDELSKSDMNIAIALSESNKESEAKQFADQATKEIIHAIDLSPANVNLMRNRVVLLTKLSAIDPSYLEQAHNVLLSAVKLAPTDPKLQYSLAASYYRLGKMDTAIEEMKKSVEMKKDYKDSRFALAMMYVDAKRFDDAKRELEYILENIDPNDVQVNKELDDLIGK